MRVELLQYGRGKYVLLMLSVRLLCSLGGRVTQGRECREGREDGLEWYGAGIGGWIHLRSPTARAHPVCWRLPP